MSKANYPRLDLYGLSTANPDMLPLIRICETLFSDPNKEYSMGRLMDLLSVNSTVNSTEAWLLVKLLAEQEIIKQKIVVLSPRTQCFIAEFNSVLEVPDSIYDPSTDRNVDIDAEDIEVKYTQHPALTEKLADMTFTVGMK